ncbi:PH domain-containing protein [Tateyamaria omphalii]|uniref:photosynthetic complex putative assembly protein PuhB n=1 Tax=Tateyamaria omphalii TaxID=299262 RepID=UPI001C99796E|nr:photosynthetic complex putative assembly protein PuhB [Tateyamaria omphalii]MBY5935468.1 PH domain-containing protein [Tateyamaria omphalii]
MSHDDFAVEPVKGLPEAPPEGEQILWQGRPDTRALAREALNINWVIGYFAVLAAWRFISVVDLMPIGQAIGATLPYFILGAVVCALLYGIALIQARATVYTITTSRIAMRIGAALTMTINLPYKELGNAALDLRKNGTGTIALDTTGATKISYLVLWPHARPWTFGKTQPALRCIPDAEHVAQILADAAEARINMPEVTRMPTTDPVAAE